MSPDKICKTVHQYNKKPIPMEDMKKLIDIARDYSKVKNYVYQRYGGINSLSKIYPGYTVQNEMTSTSLREQLGLPSVYFYLAIFDALRDIRNQWTQTKIRVQKNIQENDSLSSEEKHYLRFVLKQSKCFERILVGEEPLLEGDYKRAYKEVSVGVDTTRLGRYLRRQIRKHLRKLCTDMEEGFSIAERAYRYGDHGIYISTKEHRKRIFVPLTDNNQYKRQLYISLKIDESRLIIHVPIQKAICQHEDYEGEIGLAVGMSAMFVTDSGNKYGGEYGDYHFALSDYIRKSQMMYTKNRSYNPGRKKYEMKRNRMEAELHTYINAEINRMLKAEEPKIVYIAKFPQNKTLGVNKTINSSVSLWQKGYVRKRLIQKCREQSIQIIEVCGKNISKECSNCGENGVKEKGEFTCRNCGLKISEKTNTAINIRNRGKRKS